ncbi:MAG: putative glycoside hydrolase [Anaerolineae bacterium]|nr:putative glycoside hydrolase [Anaerolineae bacterium]
MPEPTLPRTSFDPFTLSAFRGDTGINIAVAAPAAAARILLGQHEAEWAAWRCAQITSWVADARAVIGRVRPQARLGLFGVPWRLADRGGAILHIISQDYRALGEHVDIFSPMVYHRMCGYPAQWIGDVAAELRTLSGKPVWPIIQSVDEPSILSAAEYGQALEIVLRHPIADSVLVFTLKGVLDAAKLSVTREKLTA